MKNILLMHIACACAKIILTTLMCITKIVPKPDWLQLLGSATKPNWLESQGTATRTELIYLHYNVAIKGKFQEENVLVFISICQRHTTSELEGPCDHMENIFDNESIMSNYKISSHDEHTIPFNERHTKIWNTVWLSIVRLATVTTPPNNICKLHHSPRILKSQS